MLLAIDVGNTQTVVGLLESPGDNARSEGYSETNANNEGRVRGIVKHWRVATVADRTADEYGLLLFDLLRLAELDMGVVTGLAVASSVPQASAALKESARRYFAKLPFVVIQPGVRSGIPILYDNPKEVGADRVANAVAAYDLYGGPTIVVDLGTATTFDAISAKGEYLGGAITPGVDISLDALFEHAAALRRVELVLPRNVVGRSTVESIQSGVLFGFAGLVDAICRRMEQEVGKATVLATGGLSELLVPLSERIQYREPWLTLHGLRLVFERNVSR
ncbi:MAG: type III pantothenate kinase [Actinobacteria bacterium]|jgi:type III pantothenate kinase|nr:type III pantothenate kinase [Actinomycetota bacterium]MCL6095760.1 type III pantothenate kinase [Actinomycetota bacterium]